MDPHFANCSLFPFIILAYQLRASTCDRYWARLVLDLVFISVSLAPLWHVLFDVLFRIDLSSKCNRTSNPTILKMQLKTIGLANTSFHIEIETPFAPNFTNSRNCKTSNVWPSKNLTRSNKTVLYAAVVCTCVSFVAVLCITVCIHWFFRVFVDVRLHINATLVYF